MRGPPPPRGCRSLFRDSLRTLDILSGGVVLGESSGGEVLNLAND
jgi:hypothetical protein